MEFVYDLKNYGHWKKRQSKLLDIKSGLNQKNSQKYFFRDEKKNIQSTCLKIFFSNIGDF